MREHTAKVTYLLSACAMGASRLALWPGVPKLATSSSPFSLGENTRQCLPQIEARDFDPKAAIAVWRLGDGRLTSGTWKIVGRIEKWCREDWPMPKFLRAFDLPYQGRLLRSAFLVTYSDHDPAQRVGEEKCSPDLEGYEKDSLKGAGFVEIRLAKMLSEVSSTDEHES